MAKFAPTTIAQILDRTRDLQIGEEYRATISRDDFANWEEFLNEDLPFAHVLIPYRWRKNFVSVLVTKDLPWFTVNAKGQISHFLTLLDGTVRDDF
jgi:hypothetical protein